MATITKWKRAVPVLGAFLPRSVKWGICAVAGDEDERPVASDEYADIHVFRCAEPLPEFTLSADASPTPAEEAAICSCVWDNLGSWERRTSQALVEGRDDDVTALNRAAFPARFGEAARRCDPGN